LLYLNLLKKCKIKEKKGTKITHNHLSSKETPEKNKEEAIVIENNLSNYPQQQKNIEN
jgi:hypothetical protein